jgi:exodeoxyribonuclease VII small subunit
MGKTNLNYKEAYSRLEDILYKLENNELNVDDLTANVKKASELIKFCKSKLFETESEIEKIIEEIDNGSE